MKRALQYLEHFEPARLRAVYIALTALLVSLGLGQYVADFDPQVQAILSALVVIAPLLQGEVTRATVYAPGNVVAPHADASIPVGDDDGPTVPSN